VFEVVANPDVEPRLRTRENAGATAAASPTSAVEVHALRKRFRDVDVLNGISLSIEAGTTFGLLGPNGSGKTTLLRLLAGVLRPTSGDVRVLGGRPGSQAGKIGYMPQQNALHERLTVRENLQYWAGLQGARSRGMIDEVISKFQLDGVATRSLAELSVGTARRVSLACTLVHAPRLVLVDEPTAGMDPELRRVFWTHFQALNRGGVTIVLATHDMDEAVRCDTLAVLREGTLLAQGAATELLALTKTASLDDAFIRLAGNDRGDP
jgi:ABC-2 type transport system ATP-binding protein